MEIQPGNREKNNSENLNEKQIEVFELKAKEVSNLISQKENSLSAGSKLLISKMNTVFIKPFKNLLDTVILNDQFSQQKKAEKYFEGDPSVEISSLYNNLEGSGSINLTQELEKAGARENKVVLLISGIVGYPNPSKINFQDIVQTNAPLTRLLMAIFRLRPANVSRYGVDMEKILKGDSVPKYIVNTTKAIQKELFEGKPVKVMVVRNANSNNLSDAVEAGGKNTVLVFIGHGTFSSIGMTDKTIPSMGAVSPKEKLKAFVQHSCGFQLDHRHAEFGKNFADKIIGWTRTASLIDYVEDPLHIRGTPQKDDM